MEETEPSLGEILSGSESTGETEATPAEQERDESGKFKAETETETKGETETKTVEPEEKVEAKPEDKPRPDVAAIIDERRKRQAAEARLRELEAKQTAKPSVFDDEDKAISARVDEAIRPMREQLYRQSVRAAQATYKEAYSQAEEAFLAASEKDDRLLQALRASDDPGEFIYTAGSQIRELSDVGGDFVKYREKLTGDLKSQLAERDARIKALEEQVAAGEAAKLEQVPKSLNTRSSSPKSGEIEDDEPIDKIARFNQRKTG